jgi:hypothetical protein
MRNAILLGTVLLMSESAANESNQWIDASSQDLNGYVRALSLDLRGTVPTMEELSAIELSGEISAEIIDEWLYSPGFEEQVIEQHRALFWNELAINLLAKRKIFRRDGVYFNNQRTRYHRGVVQTHCGDFAANVDQLNQPLTWVTNEDGSISEGYVLVSPYWAPDTSVEVCAFDAQLTAVSATGVDCSTADAHQEPDCGCGPNLQWCIDGTSEKLIEESLSADISERVRSMLEVDGSYRDLLVGDSMFVNGPSVHFYRYIAPFDEENYESPVSIETLPSVDFTDMNMTTIVLSDEYNGILTSPGWLLRHQTNRGRANRFYGAFLCREFIPPVVGFSGLDSQQTPTPNLIMREGCLGCHARLEPWAAYWARWSEASMVYHSSVDFPEYMEECAQCANTSGCSEICEDYYLIEQTHSDEGPYLGWLNTYAFLVDEKKQHPDIGPVGWVDKSIDDGSLARCSASRASDWLLNWSSEDDELVQDLADQFQQDLNYRMLVKRIVTSPQYWSMNQ